MNIISTNRPGRILVACECSGIVRDAFSELGWDAWSCDLMPSERPGNHYQCDVMEVLGLGWDMMIGHPPCDFLTNSGNRWLFEKCSTGTPEERIANREIAIQFFLHLWNAPIKRIAIENPRPHPYVTKIIGRCSQMIQPWEFGEAATKGTCLWLKNLPPLMATIVELGTNRRPLCHREPPGKQRKANRSRTYAGIAKAMANQWGNPQPTP